MVSVQVVAHPTTDLDSSLLRLNFSGTEFLFGRFSEGIHRALAEHGHVRLSRVRQVFLTGQTTWTQVGGLPGFLIGVSDTAGKKGLSVFGGRNAPWAIATLRGVQFRQKIVVDVHYAEKEIVNKFMTVLPVELVLGRVGGVADAVEDGLNSKIERSLRRIRSTDDPRRPSEDETFILSLPATGHSSMCYIIQPHPAPGRFNVEQAQLLGVPPGPAFGQLRKGMPYTTESGTVVTPEMVIEPPKPSAQIIVLDLPSQAYFNVANHFDWLRTFQTSDLTDPGKAPTVMHILGPDIDPFSEQYTQFMKSFPSTCNHLLSHPLYVPDTITFSRSAKLTTALSLLSTARFPLSGTTSDSQKELPRSDVKVALAIAEPLTFSNELDVLRNQLLSAVSEVAPPSLAARIVKADIIKQSSPAGIGNVECVCIGTGSGSPSTFKNVIGTIVRIPSREGYKSLLFDCGEATYYGLCRMYGAGVAAILQEIKVIFISHMHPDHHLGLLSFLNGWIQVIETGVIYVIAPASIKVWLDDWSQIYLKLTVRVQFIDSESLTGTNSLSDARIPELYTAMDLASIQTIPAIHCNPAYSVIVTTTSQFKLSYSGDTRPNKVFAAAASNSTLVIHEATLDDALLADAIRKRHSTVTEALCVAMESRAMNVLMTHISPRYPMLPDFMCIDVLQRVLTAGQTLANEDEHGEFLLREISEDDKNWCEKVKVTVAVDGMLVKLSEMGNQEGWSDLLKLVSALDIERA
ncbi:beta-lactamase-like protein [Lipomyces tetrasporus]|uniref:ribonuclease Z n=1 Tax=Lipomyces tetrasporus TaxID=54092 RepID=A0AAD7VNT8_9ASCO|nr:beta-lactamase-like protein [Lipomyces tetrasporus]KAJ8096682.1 beta-lactamase-like protein [Lipomyces tetrasporus]